MHNPLDASTTETAKPSNQELVAAVLEARVEVELDLRKAAYRRIAVLEAALREAAERLKWINDPTYIGNYDDATTVSIYRKWAKGGLGAVGAVLAGGDAAPRKQITCCNCGRVITERESNWGWCPACVAADPDWMTKPGDAAAEEKPQRKDTA